MAEVPRHIPLLAGAMSLLRMPMKTTKLALESTDPLIVRKELECVPLRPYGNSVTRAQCQSMEDTFKPTLRNACSLRRLLVTANVVPSSPILVTFMMEAQSFSETSIHTRATQRKMGTQPSDLCW
jgi:hypothetical protein